MTVEVVLLLIALWILFGLIDAWVLHQRGYSGWRWTLICVVTGPLAISVLSDLTRGVDSEDEVAEPSEPVSSEPISAEFDEEAQPTEDAAGEWPRDDPEGPFVMQGYRGLADH